MGNGFCGLMPIFAIIAIVPATSLYLYNYFDLSDCIRPRNEIITNWKAGEFLEMLIWFRFVAECKSVSVLGWYERSSDGCALENLTSQSVNYHEIDIYWITTWTRVLGPLSAPLSARQYRRHLGLFTLDGREERRGRMGARREANAMK